MKITVETGGKSFAIDLEKGNSLAIPLDFEGNQPNHFGVERAAFKTVEIGDFVGDTSRGGSCNVDHLSMIPHCNGTHTESVGHIVGEMVAIGEMIREAWFVARLISVKTLAARDTHESYRPELDHHDHVITVQAIKSAIGETDWSDTSALVIRTLPNSGKKKSIAYGQPDHPAFLSLEAMTWIVEQGIEHLLLDLPSVDKMYDEGMLTNHHLFWNVPERTHAMTPQVHKHKTITEMIFVDDQIVDGMYLLNLQLPAFVSDAAPSRPILYALNS